MGTHASHRRVKSGPPAVLRRHGICNDVWRIGFVKTWIDVLLPEDTFRIARPLPEMPVEALSQVPMERESDKFDYTDRSKQALGQAQLIRRVGQPEDIAPIWCCSGQRLG